jgi:hypothetical protein
VMDRLEREATQVRPFLLRDSPSLRSAISP